MSDTPHSHDDHAPITDDDPRGPYQLLAEAVRELLIEKNVITPDELRAEMERMDSRTPALGAQVVAHAWTDPDYKQRLLKNGAAAVDELGIAHDGTKLVVVENTDDVHNLIVCTLCSCYPRNILGLPPDWYKSLNYRKRAINEPRAVLREFGTELPDSVTVRVHDSTADMRYLVLPKRPDGTDGWPEDKLAELITRDSMIGVIEVRDPED